MNKWKINSANSEAVNTIVAGSDLSEFCARVLTARGIETLDDAKNLIKANALESPFALKDMQQAVDLINEVMENDGKICIFGDYDCDGICASIILLSYLQASGADVFYYIPERKEGYGMNCDAVKYIANQETSLIITVDNGISACAEAELVYELGMRLIITDHHNPPEILPKADAIIDAKQSDCPSEFKQLCGAGIALKLVAALDGGDYDAVLEQFGDIVCLATIADVVPLCSENRFLAERGLNIMKNTERVGLLALMEKNNINKQNLTSTLTAFGIAPRINASGRISSPKKAFELLMCEDPEQADKLAEELESFNILRKQYETNVITQIEEYINSNPRVLNKRVLVFWGENWNHGVIGIVAARIEERFGKPCFIMNLCNGEARGSARSFGEFSVFKCLEYCGELLTKYGGHQSAGGFSLDASKIKDFDRKIQEYAYINEDAISYMTIYADMILKPADITVENILSLKVLEPFGEGNPEPVFAMTNAVIQSVKPTATGSHTKVTIRYGENLFDIMFFGREASTLPMKPDETWDFLVNCSVKEFQGKESVNLKCRDYRKSGIKQSAYFSAYGFYEKFMRKEIISYSVMSKIYPERSELETVYRTVKSEFTAMDNIYIKVCSETMNYCKFRLCLEIFIEAGLIEYMASSGTVRRKAVNGKVSLETSETYRRLMGNE